MKAEFNNLKIHLTKEELAILQGKHGSVMQKVMETIVLYGEALDADKLADIEGPGHFVISFSREGIAPPIRILEELVDAGLRTKFPFTLDPRGALDFENLNLQPGVEQALLDMYQNQEYYEQLLTKLGLRDDQAFTCNPYQPEVGNIPERGTILAWSESACAIYANSVLGARTNRNGAIMDLLSNIVGKTPLAGLLTDEGRRASWLVEVNTAELPNPQLLGAAIGRQVQAGVPYIVGLDRFLNPELDSFTTDYLQDMGAMCATYGAVGLMHIEKITPEAIDFGRDLLKSGYRTFGVNMEELSNLCDSFPQLWHDENSVPEKCFIGCPHISLRQIYWWTENIKQELKKVRKEKVAVETIFCCAPQTLEKFREDQESYDWLDQAGVKLSACCCETIFETGLKSGHPVITNSNKLRAYSSARFIPDNELVQVLVSGELIEGKNDQTI
jgi:hypothetical protein